SALEDPPFFFVLGARQRLDPLEVFPGGSERLPPSGLQPPPPRPTEVPDLVVQHLERSAELLLRRGALRRRHLRRVLREGDGRAPASTKPTMFAGPRAGWSLKGTRETFRPCASSSVATRSYAAWAASRSSAGTGAPLVRSTGFSTIDGTKASEPSGRERMA